MNTFAQDLKLAMYWWDKLVAAVRAQNPGASDEYVYRLTATAYASALKIDMPNGAV
jgi:hypothetical protein